jgi:hypothetical protein
MHDGGGGHMGGGHMGGQHMGGHAGVHQVNPAHHHHGSTGTVPGNPGHITSAEQTGRYGLAAAGQRFTPVVVLVGVAVIVAIVMLLI